MARTLFGHLAHRFVTQRENLATEGLSYILGGSPAARKAFIDLLWQGEANRPADLRFGTQSLGDEGAIPDLIGIDLDGRIAMLGEAKFWAGLTKAQPVAYIRRLEAEGGGVLAVIAPKQRLRLLWRELRDRCEASAIEVRDSVAVAEGILSSRVQPGGRLLMVSWAVLIQTLKSGMERDGDVSGVADLMQLQGLADQADTDAFLPLTSEELTASTGNRVLQFISLTRDAFSDLQDKGVADRSGQRWTDTAGDHGQWFLLGGVQARLMVRMDLWGTYASTPIWLSVGSSQYTDMHTSQIRRALEPLGLADHGVPQGKYQLIPITLPEGVEREYVVTAIVSRVENVAALLASGGLSLDPTGEDVEGPKDALARDQPVGM